MFRALIIILNNRNNINKENDQENRTSHIQNACRNIIEEELDCANVHFIGSLILDRRAFVSNPVKQKIRLLFNRHLIFSVLHYISAVT